MTTKIERKFLVRDPMVIRHATEPPVAIRQAYLATGKAKVRVRIGGPQAWLGAHDGADCSYEYAIPKADAEDMLAHLAATAVVEKDRYRIEDGGAWIVDVFRGLNAPLAVAEIDLHSPTASIEPPPWLGADVSHDLRYQNVYLALHPYSAWRHDG